MSEKEIERRMCGLIKKRGGLTYKFISPGNPGVPDRIVITPGGVVWFVELKTAISKTEKVAKMAKVAKTEKMAKTAKVAKIAKTEKTAKTEKVAKVTKVTKIQRWQISELRRCGANVRVIHGWDAAREFASEVMDGGGV